MTRRLESLSFYLSANECLVEGEGSGVVMASSTPLGLWGGVDPSRGEIIDPHHPLCGESLVGRALVVPHDQGSDIGGAVLLEAIYAGQAPALIVLDRADGIIALGAIVAEEVLSLSVPIVVLDAARFALAQSARLITLHRGRQLVLSGPHLAGLANVIAGGELGHEQPPATAANDGFALSPRDRRCLDGENGPAARAAMRVVLRMARLQGACELVDVARVAFDGYRYAGPAGLAVAERLAGWEKAADRPGPVDTVATPEASKRLLELCQRLGGSPVSTAAPSARHPPWPWLLGLCIAVTGRAPALADGRPGSGLPFSG
ncbi:aconitase X swivel domain-containing protein [Salinicola socius]|nr:DUF126 domain-containing protein [Salinicola socius]